MQCPATETLRLLVNFPDCWDGEHLGPEAAEAVAAADEDPTSSMTPMPQGHGDAGAGADVTPFSTYSESGSCPSSHPVPIPMLQLAIDYPPVDPDGTVARLRIDHDGPRRLLERVGPGQVGTGSRAVPERQPGVRRHRLTGRRASDGGSTLRTVGKWPHRAVLSTLVVVCGIGIGHGDAVIGQADVGPTDIEGVMLDEVGSGFEMTNESVDPSGAFTRTFTGPSGVLQIVGFAVSTPPGTRASVRRVARDRDVRLRRRTVARPRSLDRSRRAAGRRLRLLGAQLRRARPHLHDQPRCSTTGRSSTDRPSSSTSPVGNSTSPVRRCLRWMTKRRSRWTRSWRR